MIRLALIRHGRTGWNEEGRIQGHTDIPLFDRGRMEIARLAVPPDLAHARWFTSPLARTRETATLLGVDGAEAAPALIEMDWGDWSGARLEELRDRDPAGMAANEARGLQFRPLNGETPAEVQQRVLGWLSTLTPDGRSVAAVTHRGVIRALTALAWNWDMTGPPPMKMTWTAMHYLTYDAGHVACARLNVPLPLKENAP